MANEETPEQLGNEDQLPSSLKSETLPESPTGPGSKEIDLLSLLYNSNPFYFLSALLVLLGVRFAYGDVPVGSLNCWSMLGVLAGYTSLMALAGVIVIRIGKVWDDA